MTRPPPCLKCARLGMRGEALYAHAASDHDRLLAEASSPAPSEANPFAAVMAVSAANEQAARARIEIVGALGDESMPHVRVKREALDLYGPGRIGTLKWIDARGQMMRPALHAIDPLWLEGFEGYYDSGKLIGLARKGLRAGGSSSACPALVRCVEFTERHLDAGTIGVVPIMSSTRDEADGRFVTIRAYLRSIGRTPEGRDDDDVDSYVVPPSGIVGTYRSKRSQSGGGIIAVRDGQDHRIEFRILPALVRHGVGYTGVAGFADESDLWPNDPEHHVNPAEVIFDRISERYTTTFPGAEFLIFSASYKPDSAHKRLVNEALKGGIEAELMHLMRLGERGARKDEDARRSLAAARGLTDPRLLAPGDPMSPDLPAWAYNSSNATIEKCYGFSKGNISRMLGLYGGRAAENERAESAPLSEVAIDRYVPPTHRDTVIGVRPGVDSAPWAVTVCALGDDSRIVVLADRSGQPTGVEGVGGIMAMVSGFGATALVVATKHEALLRAEIGAHLAGAWSYLPPVCAMDVHDASVLRVGPLRTLYQRARIGHAGTWEALESAMRSHTDDAPQPRVEALVLACARLVACYPHALGSGEPEPMRGPKTIEAMHESGNVDAGALLARLGAR